MVLRRVTHAFGIRESPALLAGGQGDTFRSGSIVLKPVSDDVEATWLAEVLEPLESPRVRIARPVRAHEDGRFVVDGWSAWRWVEGETRPGRHLPESFAACRALHEVLATVPDGGVLNRHGHPWGQADRIAWGDERFDGCAEPLRPIIEGLFERRRPIDGPSQLIHADLAGNLVFHDDEPVGVIDITPYWRPAGFSAAVLAQDLFVWHDAPETIVDHLRPYPDHEQLLIRAQLVRLLATDRFARTDPTLSARLGERADRHHRMFELICDLVG